MCLQVHVVLPNGLIFPRKLSITDRAPSATGNASGGRVAGSIRALWPRIAQAAGLDDNAFISIRVETGLRPMRMHIRKLEAEEVPNAEPLVQQVSCWAMPDGSVEVLVRCRPPVHLVASALLMSCAPVHVRARSSTAAQANSIAFSLAMPLAPRNTLKTSLQALTHYRAQMCLQHNVMRHACTHGGAGACGEVIFTAGVSGSRDYS